MPSVEEQKKIADLLLLIERRITTQNKIIEDLKKLKSAIYQELYSNLPGEEKSLSELAEITKGQQVNGNQLSENGKYYVMNGGIMPSGYYDDYNTEAGTISISEGAILVVMSNIIALSSGVVDIVTPYISNQQLEYQHYFCAIS